MIAKDFEAKLAAFDAYFVSPTLFVPSANRDAEYCSAEDILKIIDEDGERVSRCIRKRNESSNSISYYIKDTMGVVYWKVVCPTGTGVSGRLIDMDALVFMFKQARDTIGVRLGLI